MAAANSMNNNVNWLQQLSPLLPTFNFEADDDDDDFNTSQSQDWEQTSINNSSLQNDDQLQTPIVLEDFLAGIHHELAIEEEQNYSDHDLQTTADSFLNIISNHQPHDTLSLSINTQLHHSIKFGHTKTTTRRTSIYRGVTRHRWTGRFEAHLWDNTCTRQGQARRKGRQVYLGGYESEEKAARSYDLAAFKYWGASATTNFPISHYEKELEEMKHMTRQEHVASLRRKSSGFSRGASIYRGVTRHHKNGRWQARIGRVAGNKDLYLGTFTSQEEAAEAYDVAAIKFRGLYAVTNFEMNRYDVKTIMETSTLPVGRAGNTKRLKDAKNMEMALQKQLTNEHTNVYGNGCPTVAFHAQPSSIYPYAHQTMWSKQLQCSDGFDDVHLLQLGSNQGFLHDDHVDSSISSPVDQSFVVMGNDEGMYGSKDAYYESWDGIAKTSFDNNWIPSGKDNTMAVCRGTSLNDTLN